VGHNAGVPRRGPTDTTFAPETFTCRVLGCRFRFGADGRVLRWWCQRGCPSGGEKPYPTDAEARRMAAALDREPRGPGHVLAMLGGTLHREKRDP
jgi:hypothetical protein